ncbi:cobalt ECF transporter T component CbiQ [Synechococcus sp. RSCCF101]|uniref:cobalt ECF transporter T component CbiQ n=1 Tax=Synechococcus sp. RSCCF101 TaxID=2511069 RepID=UPI0012471382|nr:cobalt ECF transporter T component CbiQ [Synechococcus sp. RSCCF101]QEY32216.1 cobalt ECF transporter T component CbiQ [Synechococcus sp. RSCCF101]
MLRRIDMLASGNGLRTLPPEHRLAFAAALFLLGYVAPVGVQLLMVAWILRWLTVHARIQLDVCLRLLLLPLGFILLSLVALIVGISGAAPAGGLPADALQPLAIGPLLLFISRQGLDQAALVLPRAMALSSALLLVLLTVPMVEITRVLGRCGCPELLTELMGLMHRFVFVLADTAAVMITAQQSRLGYSSWRSSMRSLSVLVAQLLQRSLQSYRQLVLGLTARGYTGTIRLWHRRRYRPSPRHRNEALAGLLLLGLLTALHHLGPAATP